LATSAFGKSLKLHVGGVEFRGRNEIQKGRGTGMERGIENILGRQYTGNVHGICYEFDIDMVTQDQTRTWTPIGIVQVDP